MAIIPYASQSYERSSHTLPPERCINYYAETSNIPQQPFVLMPCPGFADYAEPDSGTNPVRAVFQYDGVLDGKGYVIAGTSLWEIAEDKSLTVVTGTISGTDRIQTAGSDMEIAICADNKGYILNSSGLNEITDVDFPNVTSVAYLNGYFIWTTDDSDQLIFSAIDDGTNYDALDFISAESAPDRALGVIAERGSLMVFGADTIQPFASSRDPDAPFQPIPQSMIEHGSMSRDCIAKVDNTAFFVGNDRIVYRLTSGGVARISTYSIEEKISPLTNTQAEQLSAWAYAQDGHTFYVLDIPGHGTFVYDISTERWHERRSFTGTLWEARVYDRLYGANVVGSRLTGTLYELSKSEPTYNETNIERAITAFDVADGENQTAYNLRLTIAPGPIFVADPQLMMRYSDDLGRTWSTESVRSLGKVGKYRKKVRWTRLSKKTQPGRVYEFRTTDPILHVPYGLLKDDPI